MKTRAGRTETSEALGRRGLEALSELGRLARSRDDLPTLFGRLSASVADLALAGRAVFWRLQPDDTLIVQTRPHNVPVELVETRRRLRCRRGGSSLIEQVVYQHSVFCSDLELGEDAMGQYRSELEVPGTRSAIVVPWAFGDQPLGALAVYDSTRPGGFQEDDVWVVRMAAATAGLLFQQRQLSEELDARKQAEANRIQEHMERLADLERAKSGLLNLAAHELRAPIGVLRGYLSMVEEGDIREIADVRRLLPTLLAKVGEMHAMVNQMLETARLEEGHLALHLSRVDLRQPVRRAVGQGAVLARPGHWLVLDMDPTPIWVTGDAERILTIAGNLLDNAVKYSPDGGEIRCSVRREGGMATVRVTDHGLGIDARDLPRLFQRFGRIVTAENSHIAGTGLGLHLCQELAELHGGEITVRSEPGLGSTFRLALPVASDVESAEPMAPYRLDQLATEEVFACCGGMRALRGDSVEERAQAIVRYLYDNLVASEAGEPAFALVRLFKTDSYRSIPTALRAQARVDSADREPPPDALFLRLLYGVGPGLRSEDPAVSSARGLATLPCAEAARRSPILAELLSGLTGAPRLDRTRNVLFVPDARGSGLVVDQRLVRQRGVRSVLGYAGTLAHGDVFALILFTRLPVTEQVARLFQMIGHSVRFAL